MASYEKLKTRRRSDYYFILEYRTRWADNDQYAHMNNSIYNFLYDSIVNTYLMQNCGLRPTDGDQYGMVGKSAPSRVVDASGLTEFDTSFPTSVHSHNDYFDSISFPAVAELALRVNKLGKSSVTYEIALFEKGIDKVRSVGEFVQVFVDRATGKPSAKGMNETMRRGLECILTGADQSKL